MSMGKTRKLMMRFREQMVIGSEDHSLYLDALEERQEIERALRVVISEKALQDWESSMPTELADAIRLLQQIAKEAE